MKTTVGLTVVVVLLVMLLHSTGGGQDDGICAFLGEACNELQPAQGEAGLRWVNPRATRPSTTR